MGFGLLGGSNKVSAVVPISTATISNSALFTSSSATVTKKLACGGGASGQIHIGFF